MSNGNAQIARAAVLILASVFAVSVFIDSFGAPWKGGGALRVPFTFLSYTVQIAVTVAFVALFIVVLITFIRMLIHGAPEVKGRRGGSVNMPNPTHTLIAMLVIIAIIAAAIIVLHPHISQLNFSLMTGNRTANQTATGTGTNSPGAGVIRAITESTLILLFVIAGTVVVFAGMVIFSFLQKRDSGKDIRTEMAESVEHAMQIATESGDIREAIKEAYRNMVRILRHSGVRDRTWYTARELEEEAAARMGFRADTVHELTLLYEEAHYSTHPLSSRDADRAISLLGRMKRELSR